MSAFEDLVCGPPELARTLVDPEARVVARRRRWRKTRTKLLFVLTASVRPRSSPDGGLH